MPPLLLAIETNRSRSPPLSDQRLVNFFTERQPQTAKAQQPLFGAPGLDTFSSAGSAPCRGSWQAQGVLYEVQGGSLYSIAANGAATLLGGGIGGTNPVGMSDNGVQLIIVNGVSGWTLTLATNVFAQITDPAFLPAKTVRYFDGYFIFERTGTNEFFLSSLFDGTTYNALDFASAEGVPGFITTTFQNLQLLFIFASGHIELWYDAGAFPFPFQRYAGGIIPYGCVAPYSVCAQDGALFFLGADKVFYRLQANIPIRISTHAIETALARDPDLTQAQSYTYTWEGHKKVVLNLPASQQTLVFDISTGLWHERESWAGASEDTTLGMWRANWPQEIYGDIIVGDQFGPTIGKVDPSTYTEYGHTMRGLIQSAPVHNDRKRVFISRLELDVQAGIGLTTGQGSDPQLMLEWSKDGGRTYGPLQPWRSLGKIGVYLQRVRWLRLGQARQWLFRITVTDPVPRVIIEAHIDAKIGMA